MKSLLSFVFGGGSKKKTSKANYFRPHLEGLSERIMPAIATWSGTSGNWTDSTKWTWDDGDLINNYPGDTANRTTDEVRFNDFSTQACSLSANLSASLKSFKIETGYTGQVTLGGNVATVHFDMVSGTLSISSDKTLELTVNTGDADHRWAGGTISGSGTLKQSGDTFNIVSAASSLGANLLLTGGFTYLDNNANLALSGSGNGITIDGGSFYLYANNNGMNAYNKGGITGGDNHLIEVKSGSMQRGKSDGSVGGKVLVDCPIKLSGDGTLDIYKSTGALATNELKLDAENSNGYGLWVVDSGIIFHRGGDLRVTEGVFINSAQGDAIYYAYAGPSTGSYLLGSLTIGEDGGMLTVQTDSAGVYGGFTVDGDLTLSDCSTVEVEWGRTGNCTLTVTGDTDLDGTLTLLGLGPINSNTWVQIMYFSGAVSGDFDIFDWYGHTETITGEKITGGYRVKWD